MNTLFNTYLINHRDSTFADRGAGRSGVSALDSPCWSDTSQIGAINQTRKATHSRVPPANSHAYIKGRRQHSATNQSSSLSLIFQRSTATLSNQVKTNCWWKDYERRGMQCSMPWMPLFWCAEYLIGQKWADAGLLCSFRRITAVVMHSSGTGHTCTVHTHRCKIIVWTSLSKGGSRGSTGKCSPRPSPKVKIEIFYFKNVLLWFFPIKT